MESDAQIYIFRETLSGTLVEEVHHVIESKILAVKEQLLNLDLRLNGGIPRGRILWEDAWLRLEDHWREKSMKELQELKNVFLRKTHI